MVVPARNAILVRQTEATVTARTSARLLDAGLINRTPEALANAAKYVGVKSLPFGMLPLLSANAPTALPGTSVSRAQRRLTPVAPTTSTR